MSSIIPKRTPLPALALGLLAAASLAAAAAAAPATPEVGSVTVGAHPGLGVEFKSKVVRFGDLDANSPDGARILFHRIRLAAQDACSPQPQGIKNLAEYEDYRDFAVCELDGITLAVSRVNSRALSNYVDSLR